MVLKIPEDESLVRATGSLAGTSGVNEPNMRNDWDLIRLRRNIEENPPAAGLPYFGGRYYERQPVSVRQPEPELEEPKFVMPHVTEQDIREGNYLGDWDYRSGQPPPGYTELPYGAVGWTPFGEPYYGDGVGGWLNEMKSKLTAPVGREPERIFTESPLHNYTPAEFAAMPGAEKWGMIGGTIGAIGDTLGNLKDWIWAGGGEEGDITYNPFTILGRMAGLTVEGAMDILVEPGKKTEQVMAVAEEVEKIAETSVLPSPWSFQEMYELGKEYLPEKIRPAAAVVARVGDFLRTSMTLTLTYNTFRAALSPQDLDEKMDRIERAYHAGRVGYSGLLDPLVKEEYIRRYEAGENLYLLAMELENPIAEMIGQLVLDPLNLLGVGAKSARDAKRVTTAADELLKASDDIVDYLRVVETGDDVRAAGLLPEVARVVQNTSGDVAKGLDDFAARQGLFTLTPEGKRYALTTRVGEISGWIGANHDPETALDLFRGAFLMASDDLDEVATGMSYVNKSSLPQAFYSRGGMELGQVLRKVTDGDPIKFVNNLLDFAKNNPLDEVIMYLGRKISTIADDMFPTIPEAIKAGREVSLIKRAISVFHNTAQKWLYRPVNNFFSNIYMGLSPGYVSRNFSTDTLTSVVDYGFGVLKKAPRKWAGDTVLWLGGHLPSGVMGFGPHRGVEGVSGVMPGLRAAASIELKSAQRVVGITVEKTMRKMLQPGRALPDLRPVIDAGLDPKAARELSRFIINAKGDIKTAKKAFIEAYKTGSIDNFNTLSWLSKADEDSLRAFELYDEVLDIVKGEGNLDDKLNALKGTIDNLLKKGDDIAKETPTISNDAVGLDDVRYLGDARARGEVLDELVEIATDYRQATTNSINSTRHLIDDAFGGSLAQLARTGGDEAQVNRIMEMKRTLGVDKLDAVIARVDAWDKKFNLDFAEGWRIKAGNDIYKAENKLEAITKWWDELKSVASNKYNIELGDVPTSLEEFNSGFWSEFFFPAKNNEWNKVRDNLYRTGEAVYNEVMKVSPTDNLPVLFDEAKYNYEWSRLFDDFVYNRLDQFKIQQDIDAGRYGSAISRIAKQYGVASATESGMKLDQKLLNIINKYGVPEGAKGFTRIDEIRDMDMVKESLLLYLAKERGLIEDTTEAAEAVKVATQLVDDIIPQQPPRPYSGGTPTAARVVHESKAGIKNLYNKLVKDFTDNYGSTSDVVVNSDVTKQINDWFKGARKGVSEARLISAHVANANRKLTLLSYPEKKNIDLVLSYIFPYHFWYNRTYMNWMRRIAHSPEVLAGYSKYKQTLAKLHAGAPEWWKYNINTNELFGIDSDNPWFFNLEATLNPLNGITGVDFDDPYRRTNWWTGMLSDIGKFGPSVWTPFTIATAVGLHMKGEEEAASRWGGRLFPQTASIKALTHLLNIGPPGGLEVDPNVIFLSGGIDPYERRRVGRALGAMVQDGLITEADAIDAAWKKQGQYWDMARERAADLRAPGQLSSFFLGVGFKGRTMSDITIDQFDQAHRYIWEMADNLSPDELRTALDQLRVQYPFMDTILISRKSGIWRDRSYAYSVLSRIPPGQKDDIAKAVGIDPELISQFWESKGFRDQNEWWKSAEGQKFMGGIVEVGALLDLPDDATRTEWREASNAYGRMMDTAETLFGSDIQDQIDQYFSYDYDNWKERQARDAYLELNPAVNEAMNWVDAQIMQHPILRTYYASQYKVRNYYQDLVYQDLNKRFPDGEQLQEQYYEILDSKERKVFLKEHPGLKDYWDEKDKAREWIAELTVDGVKALPEGKPAILRPEAEFETIGQERIREALFEPTETVYQYTWQDWSRALGSDAMVNVVMDYILGGEDLSYTAQNNIDFLADQVGIDPELLIELMEQSLSPQTVR